MINKLSIAFLAIFISSFLPEHHLLDERAGQDHVDSVAVCLLHQSLVDREDHLYEGEGSHVGDTESNRKALLCCCQR